MKPNLLIIANRTLHNAPRVIREIEALRNDFVITTVGITSLNDPSIKHIDIKKLSLSIPFRILRRVYHDILGKNFMDKVIPSRMMKLKKLIKQTKATYIIIHETEYLPYLARLKKESGLKIILNAHEYYPAEFEDNKKWVRIWKPYFEKVYREYLNKVDLFINVCDSIAEKCKAEFGKDSLVIPNAALYKELQPSNNINRSTIRMIYHGNCNRGRKIEEMIKVAQILGDGYSLDLMFLHKEDEYSRGIKLLAESTSNVKIIDPVDFDEIVPRINKYDLGIYILAPTNFNNRVALPNKLFEYIQARLCIAISPGVEMKKIVEKYNLGVVSDDFTGEALAKEISKLTKENIYQYKLNAHKVVKQLSAENYNQIFLKAVKEIK